MKRKAWTHLRRNAKGQWTSTPGGGPRSKGWGTSDPEILEWDVPRVRGMLIKAGLQKPVAGRVALSFAGATKIVRDFALLPTPEERREAFDMFERASRIQIRIAEIIMRGTREGGPPPAEEPSIGDQLRAARKEAGLDG